MSLNLLHDGPLDIATGKSRHEKNWKNKEWCWSELVQRISTTHYTVETQAEYLAAKPVRQGEIKDVGGFVGGYLNQGRRKNGNVLHRQLITLDLDYRVPQDFWDEFTEAYGCAAALYSTHKHADTAARYRLLIPLDRPVTVEEYEAISRKIAGVLGIEYFDPTTFEGVRLMYWPSTSKDADYVFEYQDGAWISADKVLSMYRNWRDASEWPISERVDARVQRDIKKQGDPLEKHGTVGGFCRAFPISAAIETFLIDVYDPCEIEDRYTYKHGSTGGGLVVYEDKYTYSHHGTDPTGGKLCNAFDLVRLHMFGLKDEEAREGTPINKMPSYTAMQEFAAKNKDVRRLMGAERLEGARGDFAEYIDEEADLSETEGSPAPNNEWLGELEADKKGVFYSTINNVLTIFNNDPGLKGRVAFNEFEQREIALKNLPWRKINEHTKYLKGTDDAAIRHYLEKAYGISGLQKIKDGIAIAMLKNSFHPVREYLSATKWDGVERVDTMLIDYLGAEDTPYTRTVTRKALMGCAARIINPGCKFDEMVITIGPQGIGKSTLLAKLGGEWFSDSLTGVIGKEAFEQLQGVWIVEMGELSAMRKADVDAIKHFIAKRTDRYRVSYGERTENFPRQCIFWGTANKRNFLKDYSGNRRFWPVNVGVSQYIKNVWDDFTPEIVAQIWAEAKSYYDAKEPLHLNAAMKLEAERHQKQHMEIDERAGLIQRYLDTLLPESWDTKDVYQRRAYLKGDETEGAGVVRRDRVCVPEIYCEALDGYIKDMGTQNTKDLHDVIKSIDGWIEIRNKSGKKNFSLYGPQKCYIRVGSKDDVMAVKKSNSTTINSDAE